MTLSAQFDGNPGTTVLFTAAANTAYSLSDMGVDLVDDAGFAAYMVLISIESQSARIAFGADPTTTLGHLRIDGEAFQVSGTAALAALKIRNAVDGSNFKAQITPFFLGRH